MSRFTSSDRLFDAVTASTTGVNATVFDTSMRRLMSLQLNAFTQNANFELQISNDGVNWVTYNRLTTNVTNTNAQTDIGVSNIAVTAGTPLIYFVRAGDTFRYARGSATVVSGGSLTAILHSID